MNKRIPENIIENIKARIDIVSFLALKQKMKKSGDILIENTF